MPADLMSDGAPLDSNDPMVQTSNALIGIAGVHYVVSELSRRGLVALPTIRNTAAYDVVVVRRDGTKHANLQVKTSSTKVTFFRMPPSEKVMAGRHDYYVLLRWDQKANSYDGLMLTGKEARDAVAASEARQKKRIESGHRNVLVPSLRIVGPDAKKAAKWRARWRNWCLE
jgi:hypothetical protein